jgi:hypothetical protein
LIIDDISKPAKYRIAAQCSTPAGSLIIDDISKPAKRLCVCIDG